MITYRASKILSECDGCHRAFTQSKIVGWIFANGEGHLTICEGCLKHIKTLILNLHTTEEELTNLLTEKRKTNASS